MALSRQDVVLGRALLAWGMIDRAQLLDCAGEVAQRVAQGQTAALGQVLVHRGLVSVERYQAIVARLRQLALESSSTSLQAQNAAEQLPNINEQGQYTQTMSVPNSLYESGIDRAVATWRTNAPSLTASGDDLETNKWASGPESATAPAVDESKRPDRPIRKRLKVPAGQERFPIGAWMVERYLASGNFGIVYRVTRTISNDPAPFALKVLKQLTPKEEVRQRFILEARTMRKLSHPGIVRIHDAGVTKGLLWFVMGFLEGSNLEDLIEEQGPFAVPDALRIMKALCDAVAYAHSQEVLHRDLKPENVVLVGDRPVLTDLGLAKDHQSGMNLTAEGQRLGTPFYMAPEVLIDAGVATPQTEVYALGAMIYKLVTGDVPFQAKGVMRLIKSIEKGKMTPLRKACPAAPKALEKLVARTLHKNPKKRPQSVAELAEELAGV